MGFGYISGEEYLIYGTDSTKLTFARPEANENIQIADYEKRGLNISFFCRNDSAREEIVTLPVLMYKGYAARDDKGEVVEIFCKCAFLVDMPEQSVCDSWNRGIGERRNWLL